MAPLPERRQLYDPLEVRGIVIRCAELVDPLRLPPEMVGQDDREPARDRIYGG